MGGEGGGVGGRGGGGGGGGRGRAETRMTASNSIIKSCQHSSKHCT